MKLKKENGYRIINVLATLPFGLIFALFLSVVLIGISSCKGKTAPKAMEKVVFADVAVPESELFYVAYEKGYFADEGIEVVRLTKTSGRDATNAVINGTAQMSVAADTISMFCGLSGAPVCLLSTIAENDSFIKIVGRKDMGIVSGADLVGHKIGVTVGTNGEFFLHAYLVTHGISPDKIKIVDLKPDMIPSALVRGDIDAAVTWEPNLSAAVKSLGDNSVFFEDKDIYMMSWNLFAHKDFVKDNPETVNKMLRGLINADMFIKQNPSEGKSIMGKYVQSGVFKTECRLNMRLSQSLLLNLEDQARWALKVVKGKDKAVPNYLEYIYSGPLKALKPEAVTID